MLRKENLVNIFWNIGKRVFDDRFSYVETLKGIYYNVDIYVYKDYLIKYYKSKRVDKNMISSLSLRNGILMKDFKEEIKDFNE